MRIRVSTKGQVVLPASVREKYGISAGTELELVDMGDCLAIVPLLENPIEQARGMLTGPGSLTEALLQSRREDKEREDEVMRGRDG